MTDYTHPRIKGPISACDGLRDAALLAREAAAALARRKASYPDLVAREKMTAEQAAADIAAWAAIAADWHWIATGEGEENSGSKACLIRRIAALDTAIDRFFVKLDKQRADLRDIAIAAVQSASNAARKAKTAKATFRERPLTSEEAQQITALICMRWHAERERNPEPYPIKARMAASINHQLRRERATKERKAA